MPSSEEGWCLPLLLADKLNFVFKVNALIHAKDLGTIPIFCKVAKLVHLF